MIQFDSSELKDFQAWKQSNAGTFFSLYDYIDGIIQSRELPSDFCIAFLKLIYPSFLLSENGVFLAEEYDQTKLDRLVNEGCQGKQLEYWMNILNIDGYLRISTEEFSIEQCLFFSNLLREIWLQKLSKDFPEKKFVVECIQETDSDNEVYITFYQEKHNT
jgi:hypothetical protein